MDIERIVPLAGAMAVIRRHRFVAVVAVLACVPRLVTMLGFRPAVLLPLDSYDYLWGADHLAPGVINPSGYSLFLLLLKPFHSLVVVVVLQHLAGLTIGVLVYLIARRYGVPTWGATLAAAPVLFDPSELMAEQLITADLAAMTVMMAGLAILLLRDTPSLRWVTIAGLLIGLSVTIRPTNAPLVVLAPGYLLAVQAGWRHRIGWLRAGAALLAGLAPVLAYMGWFAAVNGPFELTNSDGLFLWSRSMSFANCAVMKPAANLLPLCPNAQPVGSSALAPSSRPQPTYYLWSHTSWQWRQGRQQGQRHPSNGDVPDIAAFTPANNDLARRFAIAAIEAQPAAYLSTVTHEAVRVFTQPSSLRFPADQPHAGSAGPGLRDLRYATDAIRAYTGTSQGLTHDLGYSYGTRLGSPYAAVIDAYQRVIFLPGPVLAVIMAVGLQCCLLPRRRTAASVLLWGSAAILMILPVAAHEYSYRYDLPCVPLAATAAALALRPIRNSSRDPSPSSAGPDQAALSIEAGS